MANSITRYEQIKREAHSNIESGYEQAMKNYQAQKEAFFVGLNIEEEEAMKQVLEEINNEIYQNSSNELNEAMDLIFEGVKDYFEEFVVNALEGHPDDASKIKSILDQTRSNKEPHGQLKYMSNKIKEDIENLFVKSDVNRLDLIKYLQNQGLMAGGETNKSLQDNLFGYIRRLIVQRYTTNEAVANMTIDLKSYKNSLKGYLQEEAIEKALQKILMKYGYTARQSGAVETDTGQEIIYDLILGPKSIQNLDNQGLRNIIKQMDASQNITAEGDSMLPDDVFVGGIQSKSWINPAIGDPKFISFGMHASLIPDGDEKYYWHGGVSSLMSRMSDVIGRNNFLFATGSELSFTVDLLSQLRERSYVLNFHKPKDKAISNPHVYADIHNDES